MRIVENVSPTPPKPIRFFSLDMTEEELAHIKSSLEQASSQNSSMLLQMILETITRALAA